MIESTFTTLQQYVVREKVVLTVLRFLLYNITYILQLPLHERGNISHQRFKTYKYLRRTYFKNTGMLSWLELLGMSSKKRELNFC